MKNIKFILSIVIIGMTLSVSTPVMAQFWLSKEKKAEKEFNRKVRELERKRILDSIAASGDERFMEVPCYTESRSDKEFFRELGEGEDTKKNVARLGAVKMAQSMMQERLSHTVEGISSDYSRMMNLSGKDSELEQLIEGEFYKVVHAALKDADNPCERWSQDRAGRYHIYYVIEIRKEDLVDKFADALSKNDKLSAEFDREKFRQFAKDYMK